MFLIGFRSSTTQNQALSANNFAKVTGWSVTNSNFNKNLDGSARDVSITTAIEGIYLVTFSPSISGVTSGYRAGVYINGNAIIQGRMSHSNSAPSTESMALSLAMTLKTGDVLSFEVQAENAGQVLLPGTSRSILQVDVASSNLTEGLSAIKTATTTFSGNAQNTISGWDTVSNGAFKAKNVSITSAGTLAVLRAGVFKFSAQIIVRNPSNLKR